MSFESLDQIEMLFYLRGGRRYAGEPVSQLEHALQAAALAEAEAADDALVTAALLHDLGHLIVDDDAPTTLDGIDDLHQYQVVPFLRGLFGDDVLDPIRLHVDAKRYLCAVDPGYLAQLSPDSVRSLRLQGGVFDAAAVARFEAQPQAQRAARLRRWDDQAKSPDIATPSLAHFLERAERCRSRLPQMAAY